MRHKIGTCTYGNNPTDWASDAPCPSCYDEPSDAPVPSRAGREGDSQDLPTVNEFEDVQSAVIRDIEARRLVGISRYGTALQPFNGRSALLDLYEELLDAAMYVKQKLIEEEAVDIPCPNCAVENGRAEFARVVDGL